MYHKNRPAPYPTFWRPFHCLWYSGSPFEGKCSFHWSVIMWNRTYNISKPNSPPTLCIFMHGLYCFVVSKKHDKTTRWFKALVASWRSLNPWKGLKHPKKVTKNCQAGANQFPFWHFCRDSRSLELVYTSVQKPQRSQRLRLLTCDPMCNRRHKTKPWPSALGWDPDVHHSARLLISG